MMPLRDYIAFLLSKGGYNAMAFQSQRQKLKGLLQKLQTIYSRNMLSGGTRNIRI